MSLNIPIWDWGQRKSKVRQAEFKKEQASVELSAAQRQLVRNLQESYAEAQTAREQMDLLRSAVDLASESLRLTVLRYQAGEATILELVDAQTALIQSGTLTMMVSCATAWLFPIFKHSLERFRDAGKSHFLTIAFDLLLSACGKKQEAEVASPPAVQVTSVTQNTIRRIVHGDGVLYPREQANVVPKITAPVQKFYVRRGDHVKQGQLVAVLENRDLVSAATEAKTGIEVAESNLRATEGSTIPEAVVKAKTDLEAAPASRGTAPRKCWMTASNC